MKEYIVETRSLKKYYQMGENTVKALDGVDFRVKDQEFVAIIGKSGSGKSTLLHMLGGLDVPTEGEVLIDGKCLLGLKKEQLAIFRRRKIGFIFQNYNLVPDLNVYENVILPVELDGRKVDVEYVDGILELLGLSEKREALPGTLSGGQQQRAAIARALASKPAIILADEPTGNLDSVTSHDVLGLLKMAAKQISLKEELAAQAKAQPVKTDEEVKLTKNMTIPDMVKVMMPEIKKALPSMMSPERFTRIALSALNNTPQLQACTPMSFLAALLNSAQLGLEPNTPLGQAYLIPYKNHGTLECQFQIGYKGLIELAYRSGQMQTIQAQTVYENDEFFYEYGLDAKLRHRPAFSDRGELIYFYGIFKTVNGGYGFSVMSKNDMDIYAKTYSKAFESDYSPWKSNYEEENGYQTGIEVCSDKDGIPESTQYGRDD